MEAFQETNIWGVRDIVIGVPRRCCVQPLIRGLFTLPTVTVQQDCVASITARFCNNELDCALLPVIECLAQAGPEEEPELPSFKIIPGMGVVTEGASKTEILYTRDGISAVSRLAMDPTQGGMATLAQVLLTEKLQRRVDLVALYDESAGDPSSAVLVSGDDAFGSRFPLPFLHDLGELWKEMTDLPLVHLVWVARRGVPLPEVRKILSRSLQTGLEEIGQIAMETSARYGFDPGTIREYLTETVRYRMASAEMDGVRKFVALAAKHGFCHPRAELHLC